MIPLTFHIPGQPCAKGRPRFNRHSGRAYTPDKTVRWESLAVMFIRTSADFPEVPLDGPLMVTITAVFRRVGRLYPKKHSDERLPHDVKPDADNIAKAVCDALEKAGVFVNDSRVCDLRVSKSFAAIEDRKAKSCEAPHVLVKVCR